MLRINAIRLLIELNEKLIFYPKLKRFYRKNIGNQRPVIIDVGANKGQTIDFFLSLYPSAVIYAFEPNGELFRKLTRKYANKSNIKLFNKGISNHTGFITFHESVLDETSTFEELNYESDYLKYKSRVLGVSPQRMIKSSYDVEVTTLDDFFRTENISSVDVLKIDTEGHEYKCLLGSFGPSTPAIKFIQLEQHKDDMYKDATPERMIDSLLNDHNFRLFTRIPHGFGDFDELIYQYATNDAAR